MSKLCRHLLTHHRPSSHAHSEHMIGSRLPSGWHAMPVPQPLAGLRSPCSGCQTLSPPSSARPPSGRCLLSRREAALLGKVFLSERLFMPPSPGCPSISLLCCFICCLSHCLSRLPYQQVPLCALFTSSLRVSLFHTSLRIPWDYVHHLRRTLDRPRFHSNALGLR